ncbi:hypothetical protein [Chryseobacterium sp. MDT2-18]|uniref:hypothetical protein n=1 Tax=Chryseobacterium sp. MDT2-18 TaxID=1259136 RepID=UPI00278B111F|nr:hypothetical protein [Chryseobacterium sp. MDT2-18]MDQ0475745.1 hypothetical protein [Chryseobacterium sp. MDT2-18]
MPTILFLCCCEKAKSEEVNITKDSVKIEEDVHAFILKLRQNEIAVTSHLNDLPIDSTRLILYDYKKLVIDNFLNDETDIIDSLSLKYNLKPKKIAEIIYSYENLNKNN